MANATGGWTLEPEPSNPSLCHVRYQGERIGTVGQPISSAIWVPRPTGGDTLGPGDPSAEDAARRLVTWHRSQPRAT